MPGNNDFLSDGNPIQAPEDAAWQGYSTQIQPPFSAAFDAMFRESSPMQYLSRAGERGAAPDASWFDRSIYDLQNTDPNREGDLGFDQTAPRAQTPEITAEQANKQYAPEGTTITDKPISDGLAQTLGHQKKQQVERDAVLNRFSNTYSWPARFGTGMAAFMLDPTNAATAFIPGVGEEAILTSLGYRSSAVMMPLAAEWAPLTARIGARAASGFSAGAVAAVPLSILKSSLSVEENTDYGIRDAFIDMAYSGAMNAVFHAGVFGTAREFGVLHPEATMESSLPPHVRAIVTAPPATRYAAMKSGISQILTGRRVDVQPVFHEAESAAGDRVAAHEAKAEPIAVKPLKDDVAVTSIGRRVAVRYSIAELGDLKASHDDGLNINPDYPAEMQPRDRSRAASEMQINHIAQNLDPALLGEQPQASDGAPIVSAAGVVESGNARTIALRRAAAAGGPQYQAYLDHLKAKGYDTTGFKQPVLVRVRTEPLSGADRVAFSREANVSGVAAMSAPERAMADAKAIPDSVMALDRVSRSSSGAKQDFNNAVLRSIAPTDAERAALMTADGKLSIDGQTRVDRAVLARAFDDPDLISLLTEGSDEGGLRSIGGALLDVAPLWARMRAEARAGRIPAELDVTSQLLDAVYLIRKTRQRGESISAMLRQADAFSGDVDPVTASWVRILFRDAEMKALASRERMADALSWYAGEARKQEPGPNLLGLPNATPLEMLAALRGKVETGHVPIVTPPPRDSGPIEEEPSPVVAAEAQTKTPADIAQEQQRLYAEGFAESMPRAEFERVNTDIYGDGRPEPAIEAAEKPAPAAKAEASRGPEIKRVTDINPNVLTPNGGDFSKVTQVAERFGQDAELPPIVQTSDGRIIDGHNRMRVAEQRGQRLRGVQLDAKTYDDLRAQGFGNEEIAYWAIKRAGEREQALAMQLQFPGHLTPETLRRIDAAVAPAERAAKLPAAEAKNESAGLKVFHASPYAFEKPSLEHIGKGEGAQVQGHGLFAGEARRDVEPYRTSRSTDVANYTKPEKWPATAETAQHLVTHNGSVGEAIGEVEHMIVTSEGTNTSAATMKKMTDVVAYLRAHPELEAQEGNVYEWTVDAKPEEMIDRDTDLVKQSPQVIAAVRALAPNLFEKTGAPKKGMSGSKIYAAIVKRTGSAKAASEALRAAGIKGINYASDMMDPEGSEYVIFSDKDIVSSKMIAGKPPAPQTSPEPAPGIRSAREYVEGLPSREEGETDKAYAKRTIDKLPTPGPEFLPEAPASYFDLWHPGTILVPIENIITTKSADDKGAHIGLNRMAGARAGVLSKRKPIEVSGNGDGTYTVVDGNGTVNSARSLGWRQLPIEVVDGVKPPVVLPETAVKAPSRQFAESQAGWTVPEIYSAAERNLPILRAIGQGVAAELGDGVLWHEPPAGLKSQERFTQKAVEKGVHPSAITDVIRGTFAVDNPTLADAAVAALAERATILDEGWRRYPGGYVDRKIAIRFDDGQVGEIIVISKRMQTAKEPGHILFARSRDLTDGAKAAQLKTDIVEMYEHHYGPAIVRDNGPWEKVYSERASEVGSGGSLPKLLEKPAGVMMAPPLRADAEAPPSSSAQPLASSLNANTRTPSADSTMAAGEPSQSSQVTDIGGSPQEKIGEVDAARNPDEAALADLEDRWRQTGAGARLDPEEAAELAETQQGLIRVAREEQGYQQAVGCLREAGL